MPSCPVLVDTQGRGGGSSGGDDPRAVDLRGRVRPRGSHSDRADDHRSGPWLASPMAGVQAPAPGVAAVNRAPNEIRMFCDGAELSNDGHLYVSGWAVCAAGTAHSVLFGRDGHRPGGAWLRTGGCWRGLRFHSDGSLVRLPIRTSARATIPGRAHRSRGWYATHARARRTKVSWSLRWRIPRRRRSRRWRQAPRSSPRPLWQRYPTMRPSSYSLRVLRRWLTVRRSTRSPTV